MAKTKSGGTTRLGRDSQPKYLGVKLYDGQKAQAGSVLVKQRGLKYLPGTNTRKGNDDTLYAIKEGTVKFTTVRKAGYDGRKRRVKKVSVI